VTGDRLVLVESNTTGSGRLFCSAARRLGLRPLLLARDPDRYPYVAADGIEHLIADTGSTAGVLAACAGLPVAGVSSSSEYFAATAADAAAALGLAHPAVQAVRDCRDKYRQRTRLAAAGVPCPAFAAARTPEQAASAASAIGFPVVVKPAAGTGSIAVRRCGTHREAAAAARFALEPGADPALPAQNMVLIEEYLPGAEFSVELIDDQVVGVTRKLLGPEPYFVETGHDFPAPLDAADYRTLGDTAVDAVRALGLGWGGAHVELRYGQGPAPYVVEVNPRLAGGMIPRAVQAATGIDMIWHVVAAAAGRPAPLRPLRDGAAAIRFLVTGHEGTVAAITGTEEASALPGVVEVGITCAVGQRVLVRHSFRDRIGYVIAAAENPAEAAAAADAALKTLGIQIGAR
jgi:biotin carboxylase